jgi:ABC-type antimicrobial peptide transport system permease subunit
VMYRTQTMGGIISDSLAQRRFSMILLGIFSALALIMSCIGIYGVISHLASQRTHEIGIRMALGAERRDVLRMVLGEGAKMTLLGVAIGLVSAFGLTRLLAAMLFGVSAHDPLTFAGVAGLLTLVALAACYIPARRAMKVDPMVALRYE